MPVPSARPALPAVPARHSLHLLVPGLLHLAIVRSPHAHAHVRGVARDAARAAEGVVAVLTHKELDAAGARLGTTATSAGLRGIR